MVIGATFDAVVEDAYRNLPDQFRHAVELVDIDGLTYTEIKASLARRGQDVPDDTLARLRSFGQQLIEQGPPQQDELPDETPGA